MAGYITIEVNPVAIEMDTVSTRVGPVTCQPHLMGCQAPS